MFGKRFMNDIESDDAENNLISIEQIRLLDALFETKIESDEDLQSLGQVFDEDE